MALYTYLAMTAAEISQCQTMPAKMGYMACHFSPYGTGLSNLPHILPEGALLILNDRTPIRGHDPELITHQLNECITAFHCHGLLLDFQRPDSPELQNLSQILVQALPCPVGVSEGYGSTLLCPVFLPPCPLNKPLKEHLRPWNGREIWLELGLEQSILTLSETGCTVSSLPEQREEKLPHHDPSLHIHYGIRLCKDKVCFQLQRTKDDLLALVQDAEGLGVTLCTGLYQQLEEWWE